MAPKRACGKPQTCGLPSAVAIVNEVTPETASACWELRGFSLMKKSDKTVAKKSEPLIHVAGARFCLEAYWEGCVKSPDGYFALVCRRPHDDTSNPYPVTGKVTITILGRGKLADMSRRRRGPTSFAAGHGVGFPNFGTIAALDERVINDTVVVELSVTAWMPDREIVRRLPAAPGSSGSTGLSAEPDDKAGTLGQDLATLLASSRAADVELSGEFGEGGETAVRAHRVVLAARSPVFDRMLLESSMREAEAGAKISLDGVDHKIVERFVQFLYTDELDKDTLENPDALCHLIALGHRYEVPLLLRLCSAHLTLSEDTAIERLIMAEQLGIPSLKEQVMDYICSCRARLVNVQKTEPFARMTKELMSELFARAIQPEAKRARVSASSE